MSKILKVIPVLLITFSLSAADAPKKAEVKKAAPEAAAPAEKSADIIIEDFESAKLSNNCRGMTFIAAGEGQEQTAEDKLSLELVSDPKLVKGGKQSLKVEYKMNPASDSKFANISVSSKVPMGSCKKLSFWADKIKGKSSVTVTVFDLDWKKGVSQTVSLKDGPALYEFEAADFTTGFEWAKVSTVQVMVKGDTLFCIDDIKFSQASKRK